MTKSIKITTILASLFTASILVTIGITIANVSIPQKIQESKNKIDPNEFSKLLLQKDIDDSLTKYGLNFDQNKMLIVNNLCRYYVDKLYTSIVFDKNKISTNILNTVRTIIKLNDEFKNNDLYINVKYYVKEESLYLDIRWIDYYSFISKKPDAIYYDLKTINLKRGHFYKNL